MQTTLNAKNVPRRRTRQIQVMRSVHLVQVDGSIQLKLDPRTHQIAVSIWDNSAALLHLSVVRGE